MPTRFIIVDNDPVNNLLCSLTIRDVAREAEIQTFNFPVDGFKYLAKEYADTTNHTVLLLDINMPMWSGWDFLDNFEKLDDKIKELVNADNAWIRHELEIIKEQFLQELDLTKQEN